MVILCHAAPHVVVSIIVSGVYFYRFLQLNLLPRNRLSISDVIVVSKKFQSSKKVHFVWGGTIIFLARVCWRQLHNVLETNYFKSGVKR